MPVNRKELSLAMPKAVGDAVGGNVLVGGESAQQWIRDMKPGEVERLGNLIADGIRSGETVAAVLKELGINLLDHMRIKKVHPLYNSILTEASAEFAAMMLEEHALEVAAGKKVGERKVEQMAYDAQGNMIRKETTVERDLLTNVGAVKNLADRYRSIGRKESEKIREQGSGSRSPRRNGRGSSRRSSCRATSRTWRRLSAAIRNLMRLARRRRKRQKFDTPCFGRYVILNSSGRTRKSRCLHGEEL